MRAMSEGNSVDSATGDRQPDLFDDHGRVKGEAVLPPGIAATGGPPVTALSDGELIAMLPQAGSSNVVDLSAEVVSRSLAEAVPALQALWRRFSGFGVKVPYPERRAALSTLARLECEAALAVRAGIGSGRLRDGLTDPSPAVRRLAAIAMGVRGDTAAGVRLVEELGRNPTVEVIEALAGSGDDDAIVHLGQCAEWHRAVAGRVLEALCET